MHDQFDHVLGEIEWHAFTTTQSFVFVTDQGIHSEERPILMGSVSNPGRHNKILVESASPQDR